MAIPFHPLHSHPHIRIQPYYSPTPEEFWELYKKSHKKCERMFKLHCMGIKTQEPYNTIFEHCDEYFKYSKKKFITINKIEYESFFNSKNKLLFYIRDRDLRITELFTKTIKEALMISKKTFGEFKTDLQILTPIESPEIMFKFAESANINFDNLKKHDYSDTVLVMKLEKRAK